MLQQVEKTVGALHHFFEEWFGGTIANTSENLQYLEIFFTEDFRIVTPTGTLQNRKEVIADIRNGWGAMPGIKIKIDDVLLLHEDTTTIVALYTEHQLINNTSNTRVSTAVLKKQPEGLLWLFVQETFCRRSVLTTE